MENYIRPITNFDVIYERVFGVNQEENYQDVINSQNALIQSDRQIFVHGTTDLIRQITNMDEANFTKTIHDNMFKHGFHSIFRIQSYCWNEICNERSMIIVNSQKGGKTMAIIPPLLSLLSCEKNESEESQGPIAVIITKSSREVENLFNLCKKLLPQQQIKIVKAFGIRSLKQKVIELLNGCDLLITTPSCFSRFTQSGPIKMFDKNRIKHLVIENVDLIWEQSKSDIINVLKTCTNHGPDLSQNPQIIFSATSWQDYFNVFMAFSHKPIVVIDSYIETAIFVKSRFTVSRNTLPEKNRKLLHFLSTNEWCFKKTAIIFNNQSEIDEFSALLGSNGIGNIVLNADNKQAELRDWIREKENKMTLLLILDNVETKVDIGCIQILIHYSLPASWTSFSRRFALSLNYYKLFANISEKSKDKEPWSIIIMDENNDMEIPRIIKFLSDRRFLQAIPLEVHKEVQKIQSNVESAKVNDKNGLIVPLCSNVLKYAACSKHMCENRHVFIADDEPNNIPRSGKIKFKLIGINSPMHYAIIITDCLLPNSQNWISYSEKIQIINEKLNDLQIYMRCDENHVMDVLHIGGFYAYFNAPTNEWRRCRIFRIIESKVQFKPADVHVEFIDSGGRSIVKSTLLYKLPDEIKKLEPLACDLRIVNLVPCDNEELFDRDTIYIVENFVRSTILKGDYLACDICMVVKDTIITTNFFIFQTLKNVKCDIIKLSLKRYLLENNIVVEKADTLERLKIIAYNSNFKLPETIDESATENIPDDQEMEDEKWNPRELLIGKIYTTKLLQVEDLSCFYVKIVDKRELEVDMKLKLIADYEGKEQLKKTSHEKICLFNSDGKFMRAVIIKLEPLEIFLVDYGMKKKTDISHLFKIPKKLIDLVPFQAVECEIKGVTAKKIAKMLNYSRFKKIFNKISSNDLFEIQVYSKIGNRYTVSVFNTEKGMDYKDLALKDNIAELNEAEKEENAIKMAQNDLLKLLEIDENVNFGQSDFNKMLNLPSTARLLPPKNIEKIAKKPLESVPIEPKKGIEKKDPVISIHSNVNIEWKQNDSIIMLKAEAFNAMQYSLKITETRFEIFIKYANKIASSMIEFYGRVIPKHVYHKQNGQNINIFLMKKFSNIFWPRLAFTKERNNFITYSTEELKLVPPNEDSTQMSKNIGIPGGFYSDQECDEEFDDELDNDDIIV